MPLPGIRVKSVLRVLMHDIDQSKKDVNRKSHQYKSCHAGILHPLIKTEQVLPATGRPECVTVSSAFGGSRLLTVRYLQRSLKLFLLYRFLHMPVLKIQYFVRQALLCS